MFLTEQPTVPIDWGFPLVKFLISHLTNTILTFLNLGLEKQCFSFLTTAGSSHSKTSGRAGEERMAWRLQNNSSANEAWLWVVRWYGKKNPQVFLKRWATKEFICDKPFLFLQSSVKIQQRKWRSCSYAFAIHKVLVFPLGTAEYQLSIHSTYHILCISELIFLQSLS